MSFKVRIVPNEAGEIVQQNPKKPEYGSIMFRQTKFVYKGNFLSQREKVNFTHGKLDELQKYVKLMEFKANDELPGNIYTIERKEPFYEDQEPKINPTTGNAVLVDGSFVFQNSFYDQSGTKFDDLLVGIVSVGPKIKEVNVSEDINVITSKLTVGKNVDISSLAQ